MVRQPSNINNNVPYLMSFVPHLAVYSFRIMAFHTADYSQQHSDTAASSFHIVVFHTKHCHRRTTEQLQVAFKLWCNH